MAAGDQVPFFCRYAKHNAVAVDGATHARINVTDVPGEVPGGAECAGTPEDAMVQRQRIEVEVYGNNPNALRALVAAAAADVVLGTKGAAGANEKETIKNVYFTSFLGALEIRSRDAGGPISVYGIRGVALWGDADTLALMWVAAADA